jgi:tetratricopeptide (TPR) repeat protein
LFASKNPARLERETSPAGIFFGYHVHSVLLNTFSPRIGLSQRRSRKSGLCFLVLIALAAPNLFWAWAGTGSQEPAARAHHQTPATAFAIELHARQQKLDAAKRSDDPIEIGNASRRLIGLLLHQIGRLKLIEGASLEAVEIERRSIDFEDLPESHLDLAAAYLVSGQIGDSLSEVANTILVSPENARAWRLEGKILMAKNDYSHAVDALQLQTNANALYLLGSSLLQLRKYDEAKKLFQDLDRAGKDRPGLHLLFSDAYRRAGFSDDGDRELKQALRLDPSVQREHPRLADADPAAQFDPSIPINPAAAQRQSARAQEGELTAILASALNDLGTSEARQQKFDLALAHFHEAERWRADTPGLMRNIGMAAVRVSDYVEAVRALRTVVTANPRDQVARSLLGVALYSTQNFAEAVRVFTPLGDFALQEPELAYAWSESLINTTQFPQASALLDKLEKQSLPTETLILVAQAWSQMGNYPRAVESCHKALQLDSKLAQARFIAGMALIRSDHPADAVSEFRAELALDPDNNDAQYHLAFALLQLSHDDEAVALLRGVLTRDPNHAQANYELGRELLEQGKKEEAITYLESAARLNPQLDAVHYQLQSAYRAVGRKDDADRELKIYREMKAKNRNLNVASPMGQPARE